MLSSVVMSSKDDIVRRCLPTPRLVAIYTEYEYARQATGRSFATTRTVLYCPANGPGCLELPTELAGGVLLAD